MLQSPRETGCVLLQQAVQGALGGQLHHQHPGTNPSRQQKDQAGVVVVAKHHQLLQKPIISEEQDICSDPSVSCLKCVNTLGMVFAG